MKKLDVMIARFADEVFRVVRTATLEELAELLASPVEAKGAWGTAPAAVSRPSGKGSRRPAHAQPASWLRKPQAAESPTADPPGVAEITDPEMLLRMEGAPVPADHRVTSVSQNRRPSRSEEQLPSRRSSLLDDVAPLPSAARRPPSEDTQEQHAAVNAESPPASTPQPVANVSVMLRANEALVRSSGAGIVIRRKRA